MAEFKVKEPPVGVQMRTGHTLEIPAMEIREPDEHGRGVEDDEDISKSMALPPPHWVRASMIVGTAVFMAVFFYTAPAFNEIALWASMAGVLRICTLVVMSMPAAFKPRREKEWKTISIGSFCRGCAVCAFDGAVWMSGIDARPVAVTVNVAVAYYMCHRLSTIAFRGSQMFAAAYISLGLVFAVLGCHGPKLVETALVSTVISGACGMCFTIATVVVEKGYKDSHPSCSSYIMALGSACIEILPVAVYTAFKVGLYEPEVMASLFSPALITRTLIAAMALAYAESCAVAVIRHNSTAVYSIALTVAMLALQFAICDNWLVWVGAVCIVALGCVNYIYMRNDTYNLL